MNDERTKMKNARAEPLYCSWNFAFNKGFSAIAVDFKLPISFLTPMGDSSKF